MEFILNGDVEYRDAQDRLVLDNLEPWTFSDLSNAVDAAAMLFRNPQVAYVKVTAVQDGDVVSVPVVLDRYAL